MNKIRNKTVMQMAKVTDILVSISGEGDYAIAIVQAL